jgi:hypothetical protein
MVGSSEYIVEQPAQQLRDYAIAITFQRCLGFWVLSANMFEMKSGSSLIPPWCFGFSLAAQV